MDKRTVTVATRINEELNAMLEARITDMKIAYGNKVRINKSSFVGSLLEDCLEKEEKQNLLCLREAK